MRETYRYVPPAFVRVFSKASRPAGRPLYPLGSDNLGRDVLQRLVQGARIAFHVGIITSLIAIPLGLSSAERLLWRTRGQHGQALFDGGLDAWTAVHSCHRDGCGPRVVRRLSRHRVDHLGERVCRNVRGEVIKHHGALYVQAAQVLGYSHARIMFRHILPNVTHIILIASIRFPSVATEVFISFLIGVQGEPSWGIMINNARLRLCRASGGK